MSGDRIDEGVLAIGAHAVLQRILDGPIDAGTVVSPAGVWLLLAAAAGGAVGEARTELAALVGEVTPVTLAAALLSIGRAGVAAGVGAWTGPDHAILPAWSDGMPGLSTGGMPTRAELDRWASESTGGLIERFPLQPDQRTILLLASALAASASWVDPFTAVGASLRRRTARPAAPVLVSPSRRIVAVTVRTVGGQVEVLLGQGAPDAAAREVLAELAEADLVDVPAGAEHRLPPWVGTRESTDPATSIVLPRFDVSGRLDLTSTPARYGLGALTDPSRTENLLAGLLSGSQPVVVDQAVSVSRMTFDELGFAAGSVSALSLRAGSLPRPRPPEHRVIEISLSGRCFGVLVRTVGDRIPLFAGWIAP